MTTVQLIAALIGSSGFTAAITWMAAKQKVSAEAKKLLAEESNIEVDSVVKAVTIWRELAVSLRKDVEDLKDQCKQLHETVIKLKEENGELKKLINNK